MGVYETFWAFGPLCLAPFRPDLFGPLHLSGLPLLGAQVFSWAFIYVQSQDPHDSLFSLIHCRNIVPAVKQAWQPVFRLFNDSEPGQMNLIVLYKTQPKLVKQKLQKVQNLGTQCKAGFSFYNHYAYNFLQQALCGTFHG